jgi:hypothetical protein
VRPQAGRTLRSAPAEIHAYLSKEYHRRPFFLQIHSQSHYAFTADLIRVNQAPPADNFGGFAGKEVVFWGWQARPKTLKEQEYEADKDRLGGH